MLKEFGSAADIDIETGGHAHFQLFAKISRPLEFLGAWTERENKYRDERS
jgi:hypothetical protein